MVENKESQEDKYKSLTSERLPNEDFNAYKQRQKIVNKILKHYKKGKLVHESVQYDENTNQLSFNTYVKPKKK